MMLALLLTVALSAPPDYPPVVFEAQNLIFEHTQEPAMCPTHGRAIPWNHEHGAFVVRVPHGRSRDRLIADLLKIAPDGKLNGFVIYVETLHSTIWSAWAPLSEKGPKPEDDYYYLVRYWFRVSLRENGFDPNKPAQWMKYCGLENRPKFTHRPLSEEIKPK